MNVLFIGNCDNANVGYETAKAANAVGINTRGFKMVAHPMSYPNQFKVLNFEPGTDWRDLLRDDMEWADLVHFFNSFDPPPGIMNLDYDLPAVVQHGAHAYRRDPIGTRKAVPGAKKHIVETPDLVVGNEAFMIPPVDLEFLSTHKKDLSAIPLTVGHRPSSCFSKGSEFILDSLSELQKEFTFSVSTNVKAVRETNPNSRVFVNKAFTVPWEEHLEEVSRCHIYTETWKPRFRNRPLGEPGVTAREAAALGCAVITNILHPQPYIDTYGSIPFLGVSTQDDFKFELRALVTDPKYRTDCAEYCESWVNEHLNYKAVGNRLLKVYEGILP